MSPDAGPDVGIVVNGATLDVPPGTTVAEVVERLRARPTGTAVALNGEVVPRSAWARQRVGAGDALEVLAAVQGG